jgi:poly-gamma-glutamate capsule biosynthesis protein CapA/YwtB (metallophosphatase superfamily)
LIRGYGEPTPWSTIPGVDPLRRHRAARLPLLCLALIVTACSDGGSSPGSGGSPSSSASSRPSTSSSSSSPKASPATSADQPITLAFAGDVHFTQQLASLLEHPDDALAALRPVLAKADLAMVNLETAITERGSPAPKEFHFRATPAALTALDAAGVDVVTMANNHAVDYGEVGLRDTLKAQSNSPIPVVGIGPNADRAYAAAYLKVRGSTVAVLAATQVPDWTLANWAAGADRPGVAVAASPARLARAVRAAAKKADVVVVYLLWGTDYTTCPNALQRSTAAALSKAGADVVLGAHAHRLQGAGWLGRTYVDYGLGNFVWWRRNSEADAHSGVLTLTVKPSGQVTKAAWTPMLVGASGIPQRQRGATGRRLLASWTDARGCTDLASKPRS